MIQASSTARRRGWKRLSTSASWASASMSAPFSSDRAIGAFGAGRLADLIGRRSTMMLAAFLFLISAIIAGAADGSAWFIFGRIIGGLGVGAASVISPVYISEVHAGQYPRAALQHPAGDDHHRPHRGFRGPISRWPALPAARPPSSGAASRHGAGCSGCRPFPPPSTCWPCSAFPRARATSSSRAA